MDAREAALGTQRTDGAPTPEACMKYILFEDFGGKAVPLIFPERIAFDELREQIPYSTVRSAGFVTLGPKGFACHGEARELGVSAHPDDAALISRHFDM